MLYFALPVIIAFNLYYYSAGPASMAARFIWARFGGGVQRPSAAAASCTAAFAAGRTAAERLARIEEVYGSPGTSAIAKETNRVTPHYRQWIEAAPFMTLATAGDHGLVRAR